MPYAARRALMTIPTLIGAALLIFLMLRVVPGDIVQLKMLAEGAAVTPEDLQAERVRLGLDRTIVEQFIQWALGVAHLDLGVSLWTGDKVIHEISIRIGVSLQIAIMATGLSILVSIPLGTLAALYRGSPLDQAIRLFTVAGLAVPGFWMGMIIVLAMLTWFRWLPPIVYVPFFVDPIANLSQTLGPAVAVGMRFSAMGTRMTRATLMEVLGEDYIRTARAKGMSAAVVVLRHAMRNALLPIVTVFALEFAFLLGGLVVTEQVFNINGIGRLLVQSVLRSDYTVVQGIVMMIATSFVLINLMVDLLYARLDPRIRYSR